MPAATISPCSEVPLGVHRKFTERSKSVHHFFPGCGILISARNQTQTNPTSSLSLCSQHCAPRSGSRRSGETDQNFRRQPGCRRFFVRKNVQAPQQTPPHQYKNRNKQYDACSDFDDNRPKRPQAKKDVGASDSRLLRRWRRERDSNPRDAINAYTISNRAPSTSSAISPWPGQHCLL